ncbi:MAG: DUF2019 domain-containing protein [Ignavibacteriae bacterium]|nr:DUF2019 domain-containing protein [Ignavibacteriota bacterium]
MKKIKNLETALALFEESAIKHAEATEKGDYKTANKSYAVIVKIIAFLKERNELQSLSQFLNHSSEGVKGWAAAYLLPVLESEAIRALEEIAKGSGLRSLAAEATLSEWRKGNLKL